MISSCHYLSLDVPSVLSITHVPPNDTIIGAAFLAIEFLP